MAILAHQMLLLSAIICFYCCQLAPRIWTTHCHFWIFTFSAECNKDLLAVFFINTQYQSQSLVVHFRSREISHICTWCWHFKILPCTSSSSARWWDLGGNSEARCVWWENDRPSPAPVRPGLRTRRLGVDWGGTYGDRRRRLQHKQREATNGIVSRDLSPLCLLQPPLGREGFSYMS